MTLESSESMKSPFGKRERGYPRAPRASRDMTECGMLVSRIKLETSAIGFLCGCEGARASWRLGNERRPKDAKESSMGFVQWSLTEREAE